ncbi:hypothetical protein [Actinomadura hibisca]|uniref:hypothetical protein n=1 Tax=Actinomadura hibisca TaxID=68565 RepID=UPI0012FC4039|nr:hypothetical protein [Actinomadura hibisca]
MEGAAETGGVGAASYGGVRLDEAGQRRAGIPSPGHDGDGHPARLADALHEPALVGDGGGVDPAARTHPVPQRPVGGDRDHPGVGDDLRRGGVGGRLGHAEAHEAVDVTVVQLGDDQRPPEPLQHVAGGGSVLVRPPSTETMTVP